MPDDLRRKRRNSRLPHPEIFQAIKQKQAALLIVTSGKVRAASAAPGRPDFAEAVVEVAGEIQESARAS